MLQWIKKSPIPASQLAVLLVSGYFLVYRCSLLTGIVFLILFGRLLQQYGLRKCKQVTPLIAVVFLVFGGHFFKTQLDAKQVPTSISTIRVIPDSLRVQGDSLSFQGQAAGRTYQVFYKLKSQEEQRYFQELDSLTELNIEADISQPDAARNFNGFDYRDYLQTKGIYAIVQISDIKGQRHWHSWNPLDWLRLARRQALLHIERKFPAPMRHYMTGLLFGELGTDFVEMEDLYSNLGIIHLFALSGMQVGFFIDKWRYFFLRLGMKRERVDQLQLPFSIVYAVMTGWSISVIRSLIQKQLGNMGLRGLDNLAVTLVISYLLMPHFLLSAGGVLSFSYAFLLSVFDFEHLTKVKRMLLESFTLSLGILPLLIFYFYSFQPLSILLTFVFSLVFDVLLLPLLSLLFLVSPIITISHINPFFVWLEAVITWIGKGASLPIVFGKPYPVVLLLLLICLALMYDYARQRKMLVTLSCLLVGLMWFTKQPLTNEITVVDIGQGDSIFLRDVYGRNVLIDVGGRVDFATKEEWQKRVTTPNAEKTLIPYLKSRGMGKIDRLVLTHTDTDHMGDMLEVAKALPVKEVYVSKGSMTQPDFVEKLAEMKSQVRVVEVGDQLPIFDSHLEVLYPGETGDGGNDDSVVLYGEFFQTKFLFTGDLEEHGEGELLRNFPTLQVDVLKAGHHGSKGSSSLAFLKALKPKMTLISAGKNNRYKHPHQETLDRLADIGSQVYRTDQEGAIRFKGWTSWHVETVR